MAKPARAFICQECGAASPRWSGRCGACGAWNSIVEEAREDRVRAAPGGMAAAGGVVVPLESLGGHGAEPTKTSSGLAELDRVLGGGLVPGSAILVGGDPGIGKSTLLLQVAARVAQAGRRAVYLSGEEATAQLRLRAERLGVADAPVALA